MFKPQPKIVKVKIKKGKSKKKSYYQQIKENNPEKYEALKKYQRERQRKIRIEAKEQKQANTEFEKGTLTDTQKQDEKKKYGIHGFVILKRSEYDRLLKDYGDKEKLDTAINKLDAEFRLATLNGYKTSKIRHEKLLRKGSKIWKDSMKTVKFQEKVIPLQKIQSEQNQKKTYGRYKHVMLTDNEGHELRKIYGEDLELAIDILDSYIENDGRQSKRYKNHAAVLRTGGWVWKKVTEKKLLEQRIAK